MPGVRMARRLEIGQRWRRRSDGVVMVVHQVHRKDKVAQMRCREGRACVPFGDLRRRWEQVWERV